MSTTSNPLASAATDAESKHDSRQNFAHPNSYQRCDLRSEYRFLRMAYQMKPFQAAAIIRRMADMPTWR